MIFIDLLALLDLFKEKIFNHVKWWHLTNYDKDIKKNFIDHMTSEKDYKSESESVNNVIGSSWDNIEQI